MKLVRSFAALGVGLVVCAGACSSFESGASDAPADGGIDAPVAPPPAQDGAGEAPDANPCRFGNGRFDGSFCDDFDRTSPLSTLWVQLTVPKDGGVVAITPDDAAASPTNVLRTELDQHNNLAFPFATATPPVLGAKGIDCTFRVNLVAIASDETAEIFHVTFADGEANRSIGVAVSGANLASAYQEKYQADASAGLDGSSQPTLVTFDPGWKTVRVSIHKGQPMTVDIGGLVSTYSGPVPSDVIITNFIVGIWSGAAIGSGVTALYDDFACTVE